MPVYDSLASPVITESQAIWDADFALVWNNYGNTQTQESFKWPTGGPTTFTTPVLAQYETFSTNLMDGLHNEYYGLIHTYPAIYDIATFNFGSSYTFDIWNAVLIPGGNNLTAVNEVGTSGITLDVTPTVFFDTGEYKTGYSATITNQAGFENDVDFNFIFDISTGLFEFITRANPLFSLKPERVFNEAIEYKTDVITKHNGKEQRITTRVNPKREYNFSVIFKDYDDIRNYKRLLFASYPNEMLLPLYNSRTYLSADATIGDTIIYGDFTYVDLRTGGKLLIEDASEADNETVEISSFTTSQVTLINQLTKSFSAGANVFLAERVYCRNNQSARINRVNTGSAELSFTQKPMPPLLGTGATINTYESLSIVDKIPFSNGQEDQAIGMNIEDLSTSNHFKFVSADLNSYEVLSLTYKISTRAEQQYWYKFLDDIKGANKAFLAPTKRDDLSPISPAITSRVTVTDSGKYGSTYAGIEAYDRLQLVTAAGTQNVTVTNSNTLGNGDVEIDFTPSLTNTPDWLDVQRIHFINKVRLLKDRVLFKHYALHSTVNLKVRTVVE